jgi:rod shape-determining protein MreB and related proteins
MLIIYIIQRELTIFNLNYFSPQIAVDLGTSNILVYAKGQGLVCHEPSCIALRSDRRTGAVQPVAFGIEAKNMIGRNPASLKVIRPVKEGVIADFEAAVLLMRSAFSRALLGRKFAKPNVIVCIPSGLTEVERRAVKTVALSAGARNIGIMEEPLAAGFGAGLPVTEPCASMIVDIGGGTSEVAVISLKGLVYSRTERIGGSKMDDAIIQYIRRRYNLLIGERTAEQVKISIGSAFPTGKGLKTEVRGRDLIHGTPRSVMVTEEEIHGAIEEITNSLIDIIRTALEKSPPELSSDIVNRGITLTGGVVLLRGFSELLSRETGVPVKIVDDPFSVVVRGSGMVLECEGELRDLVL